MSYKRFTLRMKLSDILHTNYFLLPIVHRFDIRYGIGDLSVAEICRERSIDQDFFIEILNIYHDEHYFPEAELLKADVRLIVGYLRKTHAYYVDYLLPSIDSLIHALVESGHAHNSTLGPVASLFDEFSREFRKHIDGEEQQVFPYALSVADAYRGQADGTRPPTGWDGGIRCFEDEHLLMDEKLFDLKNLLIKYIGEPFDVHVCNSIIFEVDRLERDARDHARIEDRILFTAVEQMEKALRGAARA
ncbi:MAG: hemerythrin domain-containing protein [Ignavibacteria bacterium]|nr:hemerythrin domain-containing protein [Ignavibacteria bacterium]